MTEKSERKVFVVSGLTLSGKSWLLEQLLRRKEFRDASIVRMDDIRKKFWGDRALTNAEGVYRNELTRNEVKKRLIIDTESMVMVEMPMLTRRLHQQPFVDMVSSAESYLRQIAEERGDSNPTIIFRVILLFTDLTTARERFVTRRSTKGDESNTDVFDFEWFLKIAKRFELPEAYEPLFLDTSVGENAIEEASAFLQSGSCDRALMLKRRNELEKTLSEVQ